MALNAKVNSSEKRRKCVFISSKMVSVAVSVCLGCLEADDALVSKENVLLQNPVYSQLHFLDSYTQRIDYSLIIGQITSFKMLNSCHLLMMTELRQ